ncbi:MAG TPA: metalloregulator ArsR/SmtB family transcription factor [Allosphingosinicella sp.]|jgi:DNA-binding transcriptional ArsR family regulator
MPSAEAAAPLFAALADPTRLALLERLADGEPRPIVALAAGSALTRQAVSKHLAVLSGVGLVARRPKGRETLYALRPERLAEARTWLDEVAAQWEDALGRLKAHAEGP